MPAVTMTRNNQPASPIGRCRECGILLFDQEDIYICAASHQSGTDTILGPIDPGGDDAWWEVPPVPGQHDPRAG